MYKHFKRPKRLKALLPALVVGMLISITSSVFVYNKPAYGSTILTTWNTKSLNRCCGNSSCTKDLRSTAVYTLPQFIAYGDCENYDQVTYYPKDFMYLGLALTIASIGVISYPTVTNNLFYKKGSNAYKTKKL